MKLQPYIIALHAYAQDEAEAKELEDLLKQFVIRKYQDGIYVRAASLSRLIKQHGESQIINNFIR